MIDVKYATLHNPLFLAGTNLQDKLDPSKRQGLRLLYDRDEKELLVHFNNEVALIPSSNIGSIIPVDPTVFGAKPAPVKVPTAAKAIPQGKINAQVQDPTRDIVFTDGPGKVRN